MQHRTRNYFPGKARCGTLMGRQDLPGRWDVPMLYVSDVWRVSCYSVCSDDDAVVSDGNELMLAVCECGFKFAQGQLQGWRSHQFKSFSQVSPHLTHPPNNHQPSISASKTHSILRNDFGADTRTAPRMELSDQSTQRTTNPSLSSLASHNRSIAHICCLLLCWCSTGPEVRMICWMLCLDIASLCAWSGFEERLLRGWYEEAGGRRCAGRSGIGKRVM